METARQEVTVREGVVSDLITCCFEGEPNMIPVLAGRLSTRHCLLVVIATSMFSSAIQAARFQVTSVADSGAGSLRQAIEDANSSTGADIIDLSPVASGTILLESDLPEIIDDLTLQGSQVTLDGAEQFGCLAALDADLGIDAMTITRCSGQLRSTVTSNGTQFMELQGGAIRVELGDLALSDSIIIGNAAPEDTATEQYSLEGGGIYVSQGGDVSIANSEIRDNTSDKGAGGIHVDTAMQGITITDSLISGNRSVESAGGALLRSFPLGDIVLSNVEISSNESNEGDGGLLAEAAGEEGNSGSVWLTDSVIEGNTSSGEVEASSTGGGTISSRYGEIEVSNTSISANIGQGWAFGGLTVSAYLGTSMVHSMVTGNSSEEGGGGLISLGGLSLNESTIADNSGAGGGLMHFDFTFGSSTALLEISGTTLSGNSAASPGGGAFLYSYEGDMFIGSSTSSGNTAETGAGLAVSAAGAVQIEMQGVTLTQNQATIGRGGGVFVTRDEPAGVSVNASIISGNSAVMGSSDLAAEAEAGEVTFDVSTSLIGEAPDDGSLFDPDPVTSSLLGTDPQLGALADNGGPTATHLPAADSQALDIVPVASGCGTSFASDQRGMTRPEPDGSLCDAGSVERQGMPVIAATSSIDFGNIPVDEAAPAAGANLGNVGTEPVTIVAFNGPNPPFTLDFSDCGDELPVTLLPAENCVLSFGFSPTTAGPFNDAAAIESNSDGGDSQIELYGRGTMPELSASGLDFGARPVGSPTALAITVTNTGEADLLVSELALSGDAVFEILGNDCSDPIMPGADCDIDIRFTPDADADFSAILAVTSNATKAPMNFGVTGQGIVGTLTINPSGAIDFGDVLIGTTGESVITLNNDGEAPIEISEWSAPKAPFSLSGGSCPQPPFSLQAAGSCTLLLGFSPVNFGDNDQLVEFVIDDGSGGSTMVLSLNGRGMNPSLSVPTLDRIGLTIGSFLLALLGLFGIRQHSRRHHSTGSK